MLTIVLMGIATAAAVFFMIEIGRADRNSAAEVVLCRAWSYRFAAQTVTEKREEYLERLQKYRDIPEKKAKKAIREWEKQIAAHQKNEEDYFGGRRFSILDLIPLFGYQLLVDLKIDADSSLFRRLTISCEHTGYIELERGQETGDKKNSFIYAYYLLASLISFVSVGAILACYLGVFTIVNGNSATGCLLLTAAGFIGAALYGYIPYDNLRSEAAKRQEEIDQGFPNAISKITLLVMAGMNITKAIEETANSGDALMYRELKLAQKEMSQAATMQGALMRLQHRCDNKYLDKMVTIIAKSYVSGNANLAEDLKEINDECWLDKKHNARRMGEAIQNRLFVPTMLMFIGILIVIIVPAMSGLSL